MKIFGSTSLIAMAIIAIIIGHGCTKDEIDVKKPNPMVVEHLSEISADSLESYVRWLAGMGSRWALNENRREVAMAIKSRLISFGYPLTHLDSFEIYTYNTLLNDSFEYWQYNVVAAVQGSIYPDSIYIVGGHYDSIISSWEQLDTNAPGANDNASGVAAMLEIARVMRVKGFKPQSTIKFIAFGAEELGLYGSYAQAEKAKDNDEAVSMMLNNDMIAYWPGNEPYVWAVNIIDYPNSLSLRLTAEEICNLYTTLRATNDNQFAARSDSYPYFLNGFRALFFHNGVTDPNFHTQRDIPDSLNFEYCREITKLSYAMLMKHNI